MLEPSIEPSTAPAPTTVCSSSRKIICHPGSPSSSMTFLRRARPPRDTRSRDHSRQVRASRVIGERIRDLVVDDPWQAPRRWPSCRRGIPYEQGLFCSPGRIRMMVSTSSARPMTGSSFPSLPIRVRSRLYSSTVGVPLVRDPSLPPAGSTPSLPKPSLMGWSGRMIDTLHPQYPTSVGTIALRRSQKDPASVV